MARKRYGFDEAKIDKYLKDGRGQGEGATYKPWLTVQDVPSTGRSSRVLGCKTGRIHHFLSDLETRYFYLLDWSDDIADVREQYPLPRVETKALAATLGIRHPQDPSTKTDIVVTTDFLITMAPELGGSLRARAIKPAKDLDNPRVLEKLQIEKAYWEQVGVDWGIVTDLDIDPTVATNIALFHNHKMLSEDNLPGVDLQHMKEALLQQIKMADPKTPHTKFCMALDKALAAPLGSSLTVLYHLVADKAVRAPLEEAINSKTPIGLFRLHNVVSHISWKRA